MVEPENIKGRGVARAIKDLYICPIADKVIRVEETPGTIDDIIAIFGHIRSPVGEHALEYGIVREGSETVQVAGGGKIRLVTLHITVQVRGKNLEQDTLHAKIVPSLMLQLEPRGYTMRNNYTPVALQGLMQIG